jgi:predicted RNA-binding Zn ribbon-like protein
VQSFINSNYDLEHDHGAELLDGPAGLARWLDQRALIAAGRRVTRADLDRALALRAGLRALLIAQQGEEHDEQAIGALNEAAATLPATVRLEPTAPQFAAATKTAHGALGLILAYAAEAMLDGTWPRLKACRECRWAFYDHSRNGAGSWCSMAVCGGRVKQRAYYARRAVSGSGRRASSDRRS